MLNVDINFDKPVESFDHAMDLLATYAPAVYGKIAGKEFFNVLLKKQVELLVYEGSNQGAFFINMYKIMVLYHLSFHSNFIDKVNEGYHANDVTEIVAENSDFADLGLMRISSSVIENKSSKELKELYAMFFELTSEA